MGFTLTCLYANAAIPPEQMVLELKNIHTVKKPEITTEDVARFIPTNLQPGQSEEQIGLKVLDRSTATVSASEYFRSTELGKATTGFEKALQSDVKLGGNKDKGETVHSVNMQVQAFEQKAWIHYKGLTDFQVTYQASRNDLDLELSKQLGVTTRVVITHDINDQTSRANLSWNW